MVIAAILSWKYSWLNFLNDQPERLCLFTLKEGEGGGITACVVCVCGGVCVWYVWLVCRWQRCCSGHWSSPMALWRVSQDLDLCRGWGGRGVCVVVCVVCMICAWCM